MPRKRATGVQEPYRFTTSRGETRWMASIDLGVDSDGKRKRKTVTSSTYRECKNKLKSIQEQIRENGAPIDKRVKLGEYASRWLREKKTSVDPRTYTGYETIVNRHLGNYAGTPLANIVPSTVVAILSNAKAYNQKGEVKGEASISLKRQIRTCLNQIMQAAAADRLIVGNPVSSVNPPKSKDTSLKRTAFSVPELRSMLKVASEMSVEEGAIWWFRLLTGLRQGEILGATWSDYDKKSSTYQVNWKLQELPRVHGCGEPHNGVYPCGKRKGGICPQAQWRTPDGYDMRPLNGANALSRPKSKTGRIVPIVKPLAMVLERYRMATLDIPNQYDLIFRHADGTPIIASEDSAAFKSLMRAAYINPDIHTGHETRHSVVSLLAAQGVDFQLIKEIVGHSSDAMVEHYRHADTSERARAMETLDESLGLEQIGWK